MAERIDKMPPQEKGASPKYPWNEWLDGSVWELVQGKDFEVSTGTLRGLVMSAVRSRKLTVRYAVRGDRVYVQAKRQGDN